MTSKSTNNEGDEENTCITCGASENMFLITANGWKTQLDQKHKEIDGLKADFRMLKTRFNRERSFYMKKFHAVAIVSTTLMEKRLESCMQECDPIDDDDLDRFMCRNESHEELRANLQLVSTIAEGAAKECSDNKNCPYSCYTSI